MSPPASEPTPPNKRRKTQLACHPCRARKTGCDGRKPCCSSCIMRGWQDRCSYQETTSPSSAATLVGLDRRLRKLEETTQARVPSVSSVIQANDSAYVGVPLKDRSDSQNHDTAIEETGILSHSSTVHCESVHVTPSNSLFVQQVASVIGSGYEHIDNRDLGLGTSISGQPTAGYNFNDLVLPPRQLADSILQCYWELFHPLRPVLHRPTFDAAYGKLWQPMEVSGLVIHKKPHDVVFYATLNIVLALGCQRNEALAKTEREDLTSEFYKRSVRLISVDALDASSLEIVQLLLLRGFYLLFTPYADRCWSAVGIALRVAQAVGLHSARTTPASNQLNREMRRRVWYNCILIDWLTSVSFDRPLALSRRTPVPLPELIDDEYLSETNEGLQPQNVPSRLAYFLYAIKLHNIRERSRIPGTKYLNSGRKRYSGREISDVLDLTSDLDSFLEDLPPYLRSNHASAYPASGNEACFKLQARVLRASVMYARLAILRPFIVAEANRSVSATASAINIPKSSLSIQNTLYKDLCTLCVSTAHDALEDLHCQLFSVYRSSPWHALYFTFAAASVLVAATLCPYLELQFDQNPCKTSWDKALQIFAFHKEHVASAEKGIEALERFRSYIDTRGAITVCGPVSSNFKSVSAGASDSLASSLAFGSNSMGQSATEISELVDSVPIDESWFLSQDIYFDDSILQWQ